MPRTFQKFQGIILASYYPLYNTQPTLSKNPKTLLVLTKNSPTRHHQSFFFLLLLPLIIRHNQPPSSFSLSPPLVAGTRLFGRLVRFEKLGLSKGTIFLCGVAVFSFGVVLFPPPPPPTSSSCSVAFGDMEVTEVSPRKTLAQKVFGHMKSASMNNESSHDEDMDGGMELMEIGAERIKNVLILMSDTGGGHRASAEAIRDAFQIEFGDEYRIFVKDVWKEYTGWPLNDMEGQYKFMVKHVQLWNVAFHSTSPRWIHSVYLAAIAAYYAREVEAGLMEVKPDIIISVHPLMQHIPLWVLKWQGLQKKVIFVTVITDLTTCHPTWFHPWVNRCYCPSQEVAKKAQQEGLKEEQISVCGLPIRPSFARAVLVKDELRAEFEMDPNLPAVLLMGGGEGFGPVKKTAKALAEALYDKEAEKPIGQIVIICGRNKTLASTLESLDWKVPVKIRGFEKQMAKWMGACDCIITKAGPGTISEALIRGLPIILNDYIPGQEKGNVPYVVDNGAGVFTRSSKETARIVKEWFSTKSDELKKMSENALKLAQPEAVFDIVRDIHELALQREPSPFPYELTASFTSII